MVDLLSQRFENRKHLLFSEASIEKLDKLREDIMGDQIQWMKNATTFEFFLIDYLRIKKMKIIDTNNEYTPKFSENVPSFIQYHLEFFRKAQTKESLKILNVVFKETLPALVLIPELLVEVVSEFTCYIRLDPQNYKRRIEYNVSMFHQLNKFKQIDYFAIVDLLIPKMDSYVFTESFKFCTDIMRKLLVPRLNSIVPSQEIETFDKMAKVLYVAKNTECRDYYLHYVLSKVIHSIYDSHIITIINQVYAEILREKANKNTKAIVTLVTILTSFLMDYEIILNPSTEIVILKLRELNKSVFKNLGNESKIIKKEISRFYNKYSYTFPLVKKQVSNDCEIAIQELSKSQSYFI